MTQSGYNHYLFICDRSGSMGSCADGHTGPSKGQLATEGVQRFITEQAAQFPGATFSLVEFDSIHDTVAWFVPADHQALRAWECRPRGGTALLDAIGFACVRTGEYLTLQDEEQRPARVYVIIATDGLENASREYKLPQIKEIITTQRETYGWEFVFIGADIDAFTAGAAMGMPGASTMETTGAHYAEAYAASSAAVSRSAATGQSVSYTPEERDSTSGKSA